MGIWIYTYDANGNLLSQTDAKGQIIRVEYDSAGRMLFKKYDQTINTTYLYDGLNGSGIPDGEDHGVCKGLLTKIIYPYGEESYTYDDRGRIIEHRKTIDGKTRTATFTYDSMDRIVTETYPDGEVITYTYGTDGNIVSIIGNKSGVITTYATNVEYTAQKKLESILYGNGITTTYNYYDNYYDDTYIIEQDPYNENRTYSYRLQGIHVENAGGDVIADTTYNYDAADNIRFKHFEDDFGEPYSEEYTYDELNRLVNADSANFPDVYDLYGYKTYEYTPNNNIETKDGRTYLYNYEHTPGSGVYLPHAVSEIRKDGFAIYTYEYDANGNMTASTGCV